MSIIKCKECGHPVSTTAKACPNCGATVKRPTGRLKLLFAAVLAILVVKCVYDTQNAPQKPQKVATPEERKQQAERERLFQEDVRKVRLLKMNLKNPASFELVQAVRLENGTLCITFRATNSFNAIITEHKAIKPDNSLGEWNKHCTGHSGDNVTNIKHAL